MDAISAITMYTDMLHSHAMMKPYDSPAGPPLRKVVSAGLLSRYLSNVVLLEGLLGKPGIVSANPI